MILTVTIITIHRSAESEGLRFDSSWGLRIFCLSHARDETKKQNIFLWLQFSLTMSSHCGSTLSMVTRHFIGLLQIIIAIDYIISLSNPVYINCQEAANFEFCFVLSLNMQKVLSFSQIAIAFFSHLATYNSISRKLRQTDI